MRRTKKVKKGIRRRKKSGDKGGGRGGAGREQEKEEGEGLRFPVVCLHF